MFSPGLVYVLVMIFNYLQGQRAALHKYAAKWSQDITEHSHALDLEPGVFKLSKPKEIAASLKRSADASTNRKAEPFQSAMSMLNFYVNRAGKSLSAERRQVLVDAKTELRKLYKRET